MFRRLRASPLSTARCLLPAFLLVLSACAPALSPVSYEEACATDGAQAMVAGYLWFGDAPEVECMVVVGTREIVSCQLVLQDALENPQHTLRVEVQVGDETNSLAHLNRNAGAVFATDLNILDYRGRVLDDTDKVEVVGTITSSTTTQDVTEERLVMGPDGNPVSESVVVDTVTVTDCKLSVEEIYPAP